MPRKKKTEEPVVNEAPKKKPGRPKKSDAAVAAEIEVKNAVEEQAVATEIEVKKAVRKAGRKAKEATDDVVKETKRVVKKATLDIIIESPMGGAISTDEIAKRVPKGTEAVYVRVDENKIYWVKGKKTGDIDIWE